MPDFNTFYEAYPRKVSKIYCEKCFDRALKENAVTADELVAAAEAQAAIWQELTGYQNKKRAAKQEALKYCPHPSTFINKGDYGNEVITEYLERSVEPKYKPIEIADDDPFKTGKMELIRKLGPVIYRAWVEALKFEQGENEVIIHAPDKFRRDWIKSNHGPTFEEAFKTRVRFVVSRETVSTQESKEP